MPTPEFQEFAIKVSKPALEIRRSLPVELRSTIDEIEAELADDPDQHPDRVVPASLDGTSFVYMHPDPSIQITFQVDRENKIIYFFHYSAPTFSVRKTIFISYSHEDKVWLGKLRAFFTVLEQQGVIEFWDDSKLKAGVPWEDQIKEALESAKASLLLVSQSFLASKFITGTELPKLLEDAEKHGNRIFWLPLSPSTVFDTHKEITKFQSLLDDPKTSLNELEDAQQQRALVDISRKLGEAIRSN